MTARNYSDFSYQWFLVAAICFLVGLCGLARLISCGITSDRCFSLWNTLRYCLNTFLQILICFARGSGLNVRPQCGHGRASVGSSAYSGIVHGPFDPKGRLAIGFGRSA